MKLPQISGVELVKKLEILDLFSLGKEVRT